MYDAAAIQKRDNYICQYCGKDGLSSVENWHDCTVDHVIPRKRGGTDLHENLVTSCGYCNAIKGGRPFADLAEAKVYILHRREELQRDYEVVVQLVRGSVGNNYAR